MLIHSEDSFEDLIISDILIKTKRPFDSLVLKFLNTLSKSILRNKLAKTYPDLITFGFFCRTANLIKNRNRYQQELNFRTGFGLAVHISPSNIPINFAFSFIFGLLSGNSNAVRLPSNNFNQNILLLEIIQNVLEDIEYEEIKKSTIFFNSSRSSEKLKEFCSIADSLIVWGGDETVKTFKEFDKKISCVELFFPNRLSSLIIDSETFIIEEDKDKVLINFYNDTYLVDQNACSSPTNIFWFGSEKSNLVAQDFFWDELKKTLKQKNYLLSTISIFDKYINVMRALNETNTPLKLKKHDSNIWESFEAPEISKFFNLGLFASINIKNLDEIIPKFRKNEQTITYYGLDPIDINNSLEKGQISIDRIVPIGSALEIGLIWDGKDIIRHLSKYTQVS